MNEINENTIHDALLRLNHISLQVVEMNRVSNISKMKNESKPEVLNEHKSLHKSVSAYFNRKKDASKVAVTRMTDILQRKQILENALDEHGNKIETPMVHIGINFIHEHFNHGNLFPIGTFMGLVASSGAGKSDYLYRMINSFLVQDHKVLLCSFEFGESRLSQLAEETEKGGKDRFKEAREAGKFDNFYVNYHSRDLESLETLIDIAHQEGVTAIFVDSFGEIERSKKEYELQQQYSIMLNSKANDYEIFIVSIAQTNASEIDGEYKARGGGDLLYKPDLSIHVKKVSAEDTSGDRIVHLFKNRDTDLNGTTIVTEYNHETREVVYKHDYDGKLDDGNLSRKLGFGKQRT